MFSVKYNDIAIAEHLEKIQETFRDEINKIVGQAMTILEGEVIENLNNRVLNVRTGRLKNSVRVSPFPDGIGARLSVGGIRMMVKYARIHEYGGMAGRGRRVRIPARPYIKPAIDKTREEMKDYIFDEIGKLLKGG